MTILSSDKDLMQLVSDDVRMRDPMTDRPIAEAEVREKFGVGPDKVIEVQALCGDSTDNVPGVPGIGVKTAAELINTYGDLETLLAHAHEIKQPKRREALIENEAKARLSKELVKLDDNVPLLVRYPRSKSSRTAREAFPVSGRDGTASAQGASYSGSIAPSLPVEQPEPVLGDSPAPPRTYALVDTVESRPLDRGSEAIGRGSDLAGDEHRCRHPPRPGRDRAGSGARPCRLRPGWPSRVGEPGPRWPRQAFAGGGDRAVATAAGGSGGPQDRARCQDRGASAVALRHRVALRLHDADPPLDGASSEHTIGTVRRCAARADPQRADDPRSPAEVPQSARDFAAERADAALRLHTLLKARLVRERMTAFYETIERPLVPAVAAMERDGIKVDRAALADLSRDFERRIAEIEQAIFRAVGNDFHSG